VKLSFLGTRGEIEARTGRHRRHTATLVSYRRRRVMIDCGADWDGELVRIRPHAIVITHSHPDHAWGLKSGCPCPVYATRESWEDMETYPIQERRTVEPREPFEVEGIRMEAFPVEHSTRCPAVGYRVTAGEPTVFYAPDLVYIHDREAALKNVRLYIGDGATLSRSFVRIRGDRLIGHAPVRTQLAWCQKEGVARAVITHCGSQIVEGDERKIGARVCEWADERGVEVQLAYDGIKIVLR
jgi:phosphoribosyl 1,2-cyclic phosphodiesterase